MMPPQPDDWRSGPNTAPTYRQDTNPVFAPPSGYQPSVPPMPPQMIPPYTPPRSKSRIGWVLGFIGMGLFAVIVVAIMMMARFGRAKINEFQQFQQQPVAAQPGETELNEGTADTVNNISGDYTIVKAFPLDADAKFSIKNENGSITIETWDQPKAEVTIIKPNGGGQVFFSGGKGNLSLRSASRGGGREVRFQIKLPKELGRLTLESTNGKVAITGVTSQIFVKGVNGSIDLNDVTGVSKVQTKNGKIRATVKEASDAPMEFVAENGSIELMLKSDFDADLEATTVRGSIAVDDSFGVPVTRESMVGARARGQLGQGGQPLKVTTVNGSIRIGKQ